MSTLCTALAILRGIIDDFRLRLRLHNRQNDIFSLVAPAATLGAGSRLSPKAAGTPSLPWLISDYARPGRVQ